MQHYSSEAVTNRMHGRSASTLETTRALRDAQLIRSAIQDAYEKINDPGLRFSIDREATLQQRMQESQRMQRHHAEQALAQAFHQAFVINKLIDELDSFVTLHEPEMETERKRREKAIQERQKEIEFIAFTSATSITNNSVMNENE